MTWGAMTQRVLEAAQALAGDGIEAEVLETPWLNPFDTGAVVASAARTGRLAVVHEANVTGDSARRSSPASRGRGCPARAADPDRHAGRADAGRAGAGPGSGAGRRAHHRGHTGFGQGLSAH
ncbi:transketolase C-terminal domain-containing protein [Nonomuraea thailandensis]